MERAAGAALLLSALLFVTLLNLTPIHSSDFWIQLEIGEQIRETGRIPRTVLFTFTEARDREFVAHEWLPSLAWSALYERIGIDGMVVAKAVTALGLFALAFLLAWRTSRNSVVSIGVAALCLLMLNSRTRMRPELIAYVLALVELNLLEAYRRSGRSRWLIGVPVVAALWANCHGSFPVGLGLPGVYLLGMARRSAALPLGLCLALSVLASLATPHGPRLFSHALELGGSAYFRENIREWSATFHPGFRDRPYFAIWLVGLVGIWVSALVSPRRMNGVAWLLLAVFSVLSGYAIRHIGWLGIAAVGVLPHTCGGLFPRVREQRIAAASLAALLLAGSLLVSTRGNVRGLAPGLGRASPMGDELLAFLRDSGIEGRVFNSYNLGDELVHHFHPRLEVTIDSRGDAYGEEYHRRFMTLSGRSFRQLGEPAELLAFLDRYGVDTIVNRPFNVKNWAARGQLAALAGAGWDEVYRGPDAFVFRRGAASDP